jgi:hypothetical protein
MSKESWNGTYSESDELIVGIDSSWSNDFRLGVRGWCVSKIGPLDEVVLVVDKQSVIISEWKPRPDIQTRFSQYLSDDRCGFSVQIDRVATHHIEISGKKGADLVGLPITFKGWIPQTPPRFTGENIWHSHFVEEVNRRQLHVLEIGSRIVVAGTKNKRDFFPEAASYTGFDYYGGPNVDVVGDAHKLSRYFPNRKFGAIFSHSVLEHVAMPWVVALEMAKILELGGLVFHHVPSAWPLHELPWDFYRFSIEGMKALFPPALGFESVKAGYEFPVQIHMHQNLPDLSEFPYAIGFGFVAFMAQKVREVDLSRYSWQAGLMEVVEAGSTYPKPG